LNSENQEKEKTMKYYQWIKGDNAGKVVTWTGETYNDEVLETNYIVFNDGSRANTEIIGDFLLEVKSEKDEDLILQDELKPVVQQKNINKEVIKEAVKEIVREEIKMSPIHQVLSDSKKTKTTVSVSIVVDIPPPNLMSILTETYPGGEDEVLRYISNSINIESVREQIAKQIWLTAFDINKIQKRKTLKNGEKIERRDTV
jgi:hypothetical protein